MLKFTADKPVSPEQFRDVLLRSSLGQRRPIDNPEVVRGMITHADLLATCWDGDVLVGVARSVTDFHYCCYLSDLAVDRAYQRQGIGKRLVALTQSKLPASCTIILLAAPAAQTYYQHLGFDHHPQAWILPGTRQVKMGKSTECA